MKSTYSIAYLSLTIFRSRSSTENTLHVTKLQSTGLQVAYFGVGYFAYSPVAVSKSPCMDSFSQYVG